MTGILVVDKPAGWTSHDVVAKLRGVYQERHAGHAGTLDPMATGVLTVFFGRATRAAVLCENDEKEYEAVLRLGVVTDTQDITGTVLQQQPAVISDAALRDVLHHFEGKQKQTPPMYSAVKVGGRKLYDLARKGQEIERRPREITIHALELLGKDGSDVQLRICCSKGTYIRTLCHDIGVALGCGGCMAALRRTRAGHFSIDEALSLDAIQAARDAGTHEKLLHPVDSLFSEFEALYLNDRNTFLCKNGQNIPMNSSADGDYRVYGSGGEFLMLGRLQNGTLRTVKSFFEVN